MDIERLLNRIKQSYPVRGSTVERTCGAGFLSTWLREHKLAGGDDPNVVHRPDLARQSVPIKANSAAKGTWTGTRCSAARKRQVLRGQDLGPGPQGSTRGQRCTAKGVRSCVSPAAFARAGAFPQTSRGSRRVRQRTYGQQQVLQSSMLAPRLLRLAAEPGKCRCCDCAQAVTPARYSWLHPQGRAFLQGFSEPLLFRDRKDTG